MFHLMVKFLRYLLFFGYVPVFCVESGSAVHGPTLLEDTGCQQTSSPVSPGQVHTIRIRVHHLERSYNIYVPKRYKYGDKTPLLFHFHGQTGNASNASDYNTLSEIYNFIAVYPQGLSESGNCGTG